MSFRKIGAVVVLLFMRHIVTGQPVAADLSGKSYQWINRQTSYLSSSSLIPLDSALYAEALGRFQPLPDKKILFLGFESHYYWYRFVLSNPDSVARDLVLITGGMGIRDGTLWQRGPEGWFVTGRTGYKWPFATRSYPFRHHAFAFRMPAHRTDSFMVRLDESHAYKCISFVLTDPSHTRYFEHRMYFSLGILLGVLMIFALFNLYLFIASRERTHLWYFFYVVTISCFIVKDEGLDPEFLGLDCEACYRATYMGAIASLAVGFLQQMAQSFLLNIPRKSLLFRMGWWMKWITFLLAGIQFVMFYVQPGAGVERAIFEIANKSGMLALLIMATTCVYSYYKGFRLAFFLLAGELFFLVGIVVRGLFLDSERSIFPPSIYEMGLMAEVVVISFGLMYRYNQYKKEKDALAFQLQDEKIRSARDIVNTQEEEQRRIAHDLHDELGGNLAAIKMTLESFRLAPVQQNVVMLLIDETAARARQIAHDLMPPEFESAGLHRILEKFYERLNGEGRIMIRYYASAGEGRLSRQTELMLYRVIMELTNNMLRHSGATEASVQIVYHEDHLIVEVEDNGRGIDDTMSAGMGLKNVRQRVHYLNGTMHIDGSAKGTTIVIRVPYQDQELRGGEG